jgi:class 3 adenylate cyclase
MDIHRDVDGSVDELMAAHRKDLEAQVRFGVRYLSWWFNPHARSVCCLVDAPNVEAASAVHLEAHGVTADKVIEVQPDVVEAFLGGSVDGGLGRMVVPATGGSDGGFRTILFTDVVDSTGITQRLGDVRARKLLRVHDDYVRTEAEAFGGRVVKHTGDGAMVVFPACSAAVRAAVLILRRLVEYNEHQPEESLRIRIGISAGEPVDEGEDLFGTAVQVARRVCDAAPPERIWVANVVRELCAGKEFRFADLGARTLKGIEDPITVHEVWWRQGAPT